jgi:phosphoglycolate phosphatase
VNPAPLAVFDMDGTILDAFGDIHAALNQGLASVGLPGHDLATVRTFVGDGIATLVTRALPHGAGQQHAAVLEATRAHYAAHPVDHARLYPGVESLVRRLRAEGWRTAVLSNKPDNLVARIAELMDLGALFDVLQGELPGLPIKPDPAPLRHLAQRLAGRPVVMIGDGLPDAQVARAADVAFVGVDWGIEPRGALEPYGPVASTAGEVGELLARIRAGSV